MKRRALPSARARAVGLQRRKASQPSGDPSRTTDPRCAPRQRHGACKFRQTTAWALGLTIDGLFETRRDHRRPQILRTPVSRRLSRRRGERPAQISAEGMRSATVKTPQALAQGTLRRVWRARSAECLEASAGKSDMIGPDPTALSRRLLGPPASTSIGGRTDQAHRHAQPVPRAPCKGGAALQDGRFSLTSISGLQPCMDTTPHERPLPSHISASLLVSGLSRPFPIGPSPLAAWAGCRRTRLPALPADATTIAAVVTAAAAVTCPRSGARATTRLVVLK